MKEKQKIIKFCRNFARIFAMDAKTKDDEKQEWFTTENGTHVHLEDGESKKDAMERQFSGKTPAAKKEAKRETESRANIQKRLDKLKHKSATGEISQEEYIELHKLAKRYNDAPLGMSPAKMEKRKEELLSKKRSGDISQKEYIELQQIHNEQQKKQGHRKTGPDKGYASIASHPKQLENRLYASARELENDIKDIYTGQMSITEKSRDSYRVEAPDGREYRLYFDKRPNGIFIRKVAKTPTPHSDPSIFPGM